MFIYILYIHTINRLINTYIGYIFLLVSILLLKIFGLLQLNGNKKKHNNYKSILNI